MRIFNPILYVGLGGTGLQLGSKLERRFREELCGPDGHALIKAGVKNLEPFELPSAVQFVYADYDETDLSSVLSRLDPNDKNVGVIGDLAPAEEESYSECVNSLRASNAEDIKDWVPPGEIPVAPLSKGAGQFPTAGRVALWQTLVKYGGYNSISRTLETAVKRQASGASRGQLKAISDRYLGNAYDVYVGFSVAGGTGCGVFYDFLHYIHDAYTILQDATIRIYPLVMLPSIIPDVDADDLRLLRLNGARAVIDLYSLIDHLNAPLVENDRFFELPFHDGNSLGALRMPASRVPTAFTFSLPTGVKSEDMYDSVTSLVVTLSGTEIEHDPQADDGKAAQTSFASGFINKGVHRNTPAASGIGMKGVSSSVVASLEVPHDKIISIIGDHLLARAVEQYRAVPSNEDNGKLLTKFVESTELVDLKLREADGVGSLVEGRGAEAITAELNDRGDLMMEALESYDEELKGRIQGVAAFRYRLGLRAVMAEGVDPFRAQRVVSGHNSLEGASKGGLKGWMDWSMRHVDPNSDLESGSPPTPLGLRDRLFGLIPLRPGHHTVQSALREQNQWFNWRVTNLWSAQWRSQQQAWNKTLAAMETELATFCTDLSGLQDDDAEAFGRGVALYEPRQLVRYRLPRGDTEQGLRWFYTKTIERLREVRDLGTVGESEIVNHIVADASGAGGASGWRPILTELFEEGSGAALSALRSRIHLAVRKALVDDALGRMLPSLNEELQLAADGEPPAELLADLSELVTPEVIPGGSSSAGRLRMLVSYPNSGKSEKMEAFIKANTPNVFADAQFAPNRSEMLSVVVYRTEMGIEDIREVRDMIGLWVRANRRPLEHDKLYWRQRLGYATRSLQVTPGPRAFILKRLLQAMWTGLVDVEPSVESPEVARFYPNREPNTLPFELKLSSYRGASSWANLVDAYETFVMTATDLERDICRAVVPAVDPEWISTGDYRQPSKLFLEFLELAKKQPQVLESVIEGLDTHRRDRALHYQDFWVNLLPAALSHKFESNDGYQNLNELITEHQQKTSG